MPNTIRPESEPGVATPEKGQVTLDGPDGVAVSMTPEAAIETGRRLIEAGEAAAQQTSEDGEQRDEDLPA